MSDWIVTKAPWPVVLVYMIILGLRAREIDQA